RCPLCGSNPSILDLDTGTYDTTSCPPISPAGSSAEEVPLEVSVTEARRLCDTAPDRTAIIDVREPYELEICRIEGAEHIPMRQIPDRADTLPAGKHLLVLCHSGGRSRRVTEFLRARGLSRVSNIAGGIDAWAEILEPAMRRY
ncbi:MAG: rhodanese-like domain-containing protein, partial [Opitutus sp.]